MVFAEPGAKAEAAGLLRPPDDKKIFALIFIGVF